jgi:hypothetical protein
MKSQALHVGARLGKADAGIGEATPEDALLAGVA